ncbi:hypothetical protein SAMN05216223_12742 [Actinacidiphila yanglinensis]|uniref:Uncharacterized protein n=1 Tax=Actinacidiphila yanglinensis TaxID=310779 RepID=A0A1H6E696_9ACTN|nr:hypothetical protein [Actinacidiphila yanglinensis]SEG93167.1 hypothetical protein SAMN05216223_12742 [Actinacidiphila yanglinensis]
MNITVKVSADSAAAARHARFGQLPERVQFEDMVEVKQVEVSEAVKNGYNSEASWNHFNCLAMDLGL